MKMKVKTYTFLFGAIVSLGLLAISDKIFPFNLLAWIPYAIMVIKDKSF